MVTKSVIVCDACKQIVQRGFAFKGNVNLVENGEDKGGMIGNNFKEIPVGDGDGPMLKGVSHYCNACSMDILQLKDPTPRIKGNPTYAL